MRVPFAPFAIDKVMVRVLRDPENGCGGGIDLARLNRTWRVAGSACLWRAYVEGLFTATAAYGDARADNYQAADRFREAHV